MLTTRSDARRRSVNEGVSIGVPIGIASLLLLIIVSFLWRFYYRSRRSHLVSQRTVNLLDPENEIMTTNLSPTSVSSPCSSRVRRDKELPQIPQNVYLAKAIVKSYYPSKDNGIHHRSLSLSSSSFSTKTAATTHPQRKPSLKVLTKANPMTSSSKANLRIANLTDDDTLFINQITTPITNPSAVNPIGKHWNVSLRHDSEAERDSPAMVIDHIRTSSSFTTRHSRHSLYPSSIMKTVNEYTTATTTPPSLVAGKEVPTDTKPRPGHDQDPSINHRRKESKLAINIPLKFLHLDPSQKSAFSEKGPETALPLYSSPGNGQPLRISMFYPDSGQKSPVSERAPEMALPSYSSPVNGHPLRPSKFA